MRCENTSGLAFVGIVVVALSWPPGIAKSAPISLVGRDTTLYRFNADGNNLIEEFPNQAGNIVGMTLVPPDVAVTGCAPGAVIAIEGSSPMRRVWRVDGAACGTPSLTQIGQASIGATDLAFAHGRLFGITGGGGIFAELDTTDFHTISTIDLTPNNEVTGVGFGLAFDGSSTWYTYGAGDDIYRFPDPPTPGSLQWVGDSGIGFNDSDLEYFGGVLWGGIVHGNPNSRITVGRFDVQTGAFTLVWEKPQTGSLTLGMVMLPERAATAGDINCDGQTNGADIAPFILAMMNPTAFAGAFPECNRLNADLSGDCLVDSNDIAPFVNVLLGS